MVQLAVYNLLDDDYVNALIDAAHAGVSVQVLMDYKNLMQPYVRTYDSFEKAGLAVAPHRNDSQKDLSAAQKASLNLIGVKVTGIMHMKLRYFAWLETDGGGSGDGGGDGDGGGESGVESAQVKKEVVVSGSLNPEDTAVKNEDTLLVVRDDAATISAYRAAYTSLLAPKPTATNAYDPSKRVNVLFSQAVVPKGSEDAGEARRVLLALVAAETEAVLISVYSMRSIVGAGGEGAALVEALCAAQRRGVAVAVVTDKGQADGEKGFAGGDDTVTALRISQCGGGGGGRIPVYKAQNYASRYTALHHKNAIFGLKKRTVVWTDTANWSEASLGNGTSAAKPHNSETTMIIDDAPLARRFLSNFLQLVRKYAYQQACPYEQVSPTSGKATVERANCATEMPFHQPDWVMPDARAVIGGLVRAAEAKAPGTWPAVGATFVAKGAPAGGAMTFSVNGGANTTAHLDGKGQSPLLNIPLGSLVDITVFPAAAAAAAAAAAGGGAPPTVGAPPEPYNVQGVVVDAAFDWSSDNDAKAPVRRTDEVLGSGKVTISV